MSGAQWVYSTMDLIYTFMHIKIMNFYTLYVYVYEIVL